MIQPNWPEAIASLPLDEQLRLSLYLAQPCELWAETDMDRVHVELELLFLEEAEQCPKS